MLNEVGFFLVLLLGIVMTPMIAGALHHLTNQPAYLTSTLVILLIFIIQVNRKDKAFLQKLTNKAFWILFSEYFLLSLPFLAYLVSRSAWMPILTIVPALFIAPLLNVTISIRGIRERPLFTLPKWFNSSFEWMSGLRKNWIYLVPVYLLGIGLSHFMLAILLALFFLSITTCAFYQEGEPRVFLELNRRPPRAFLNFKVIWHLKTFWLLCLPFVALFFIFHGSYWYIFLVVAVIVSLFPVIAITLKYSSYQPDTDLQQNNIILAVMIAFLSFPFTQPVPLIMAIVYYRKAINNLKTYLQ